MSKEAIYIGKEPSQFDQKQIKGNLVKFAGESYYKISNADAMRPFFMSIVSDSNHWMFISSNGGLTAGRKNSEYSLFPYYTDDKITESSEITGSKSIFQVHLNNKLFLWEPFSEKYTGIYKIQRNLYKNGIGNKIVFEEINEDLGLTFWYQWNSSNSFGFVKKANLINNTDEPIEITILDGIQNIVPYGVPSDTQNRSSNLVDAYKKNELEKETGVGIYALSAIIVDKAEPSEALKATIAWSTGLKNVKHLISSLQLNEFRKGNEIREEIDVKAEKGAYFISSEIILQPKAEKSWMIIANVNQSITAINEISEKIKHENNLSAKIQDDIDLGAQRLTELIEASDGVQLTSDTLRNSRHLANTLFNIMRGGIFDDNYKIEKHDFIKYIKNANKRVYQKEKDFLNNLPEEFEYKYLKTFIEDDCDVDFKRLTLEYMPLKFSRRHGDPSRPWNRFSINTRSEIDGSKILDYEGNWRDIFQNWEALAHSYPEFIDSMIHKFLNASTFDGYNPYRVTKDGFDWEIIEPDDPWSYIGYWGDHQIIYLLKFLEFIEDYYPNKLTDYFVEDIFVYANVPYKIKSYKEIIKNPKDTIIFDERLDRKIRAEREELGADGAILRDETSVIYRVNLLEKLLATVLAKISNFIPEAGIWMNTQRPEWNDANNALVGNGVSMVTLYYLRRFLNFFEIIASNSTVENFNISTELSEFFNRVLDTLDKNSSILSGKVSDADRKTILDSLGIAGSSYRMGIYENGFSSEKSNISKKTLLKFLKISKSYLEHSINANKRQDNLYHSYNLMTIKSETEISISYLPEMLEGQVAVLSSGYISSESSVRLLDALKNSALFRPDQYSYILYPNKELPRFINKNNIELKSVESSELLQQLLKDGNTQVIEKDVLGNFHFNGNFNNVGSVKQALRKLPKDKYGVLVENESQLVYDIFESIFDHKSFTGRSGTFFGYEGLGSIYWHMVSKLLLAVQETCLSALENNESQIIIGKLFDHYFEINEGIGAHKSPELYGAVPTDPYSHTPFGKGAQQPGMTGQVKEDILSRRGELGVSVKNGVLQFNPQLLRREEFLKESKVFSYTDLNKEIKTIRLNQDSICFTYCQVPVIYKLSNQNSINVHYTSDMITTFENLRLDLTASKKIFERTGEIDHIEVLLEK
ncbi:hypothetical protein RXV94_05750 [Yeosuana sp. MJ-SS3]|uniref:Uncharacterized protein n=1 Tax=Gilvirhabdus luticola TaxID=3079858 RepID=A0ABU3U5H9_9FLAO|nr:hypothetical protein [Yeosuana sp. MJ-SS3]MDU8885655.1 hypothetical protein [Yeosuana sp. MJ-SS3]